MGTYECKYKNLRLLFSETPHHADEKQAYTSALQHAIDDIRDHLRHCITDIGSSCSLRRLQLNNSEKELAWFTKRSRLAKLFDVNSNVTAERTSSNHDCCLLSQGPA